MLFRNVFFTILCVLNFKYFKYSTAEINFDDVLNFFFKILYEFNFNFYLPIKK